MLSIPPGTRPGNYLYFISNREFAPQISNIEFNFATNRDSYIYAMALRKDVKHPFPPESDEVASHQAERRRRGPPEPKKEGEGEKPRSQTRSAAGGESDDDRL